MTCRILVWVRDGALQPTAVYRPWASCTFQTRNSCTSYFLSGRFLHKIMLQKARRGKEINRVLLTSHFCIFTFQRERKRPKAALAKACDRKYMHTVLVTNNEPCENLTSGLGIIWAVTFSTHCSEQKKVFNWRGLNQVNSTWKKRTRTRCCNRLDNKDIPCIVRTRVSLNAWNFLPYLSRSSSFFIMIIFWAVLTHVLQKEWQLCR